MSTFPEIIIASFSRIMPTLGERSSTPRYVRICTDGSLSDSHAAAGWIMFCAWEHDEIDIVSLPATKYCGAVVDEDALVMPRCGPWEAAT